MLAALILGASEVTITGGAIISIGMQILLPFILGQIARPLIGGFIASHGLLTQVVDRGSILLIVYSAFSAGVVAGVWYRVSLFELGILAILAVTLLR
jgi:sodium/bile acid cotransporter 7